MKMQNPGLTGEDTARLRLTVEPVPKTLLANKNLRTSLLKSRWDKERKRIYAEYGYRCGICEVTPDDGRLECHEVFEYDDVVRVQKLSKLIALCSRCHSVKNWGWARKAWGPGKAFSVWEDEKRLAAYREGKYRIDREGNEIRVALLEDHFMAVNGCDSKL